MTKFARKGVMLIVTPLERREVRVVGTGTPPHEGDTVSYAGARALFQGIDGGKWWVENGPGRVSLVEGITVLIECPHENRPSETTTQPE